MTLYFEDFPAGEELEIGERTFTRDELARFARDWDPQPHLLDGERASDWQVFCTWGLLYVAAVHLKAASQGGAGVSDFRFPKPVRAGDRLRGRVRVLEARASSTKPERGTLVVEGVFVDGADELVFAHRSVVFFGRRPGHVR
jgi:acyl dehydratase